MNLVTTVGAGLLLAACGAGDSGAIWGGTTETVNGRTTVHNPAVGLWGAGKQGQLVEDLRIGAMEGTGPDVWGTITAFAVSSAGHIAVLDGQAQEVRVFDSEGRFLRTIGRKGEGPGEFEGAVAVHFDRDDRIWVVDARNARYEVFDETGTHVRSTSRRGGVVLGDPGMMTSIGLLDPVPQFTREGEIREFYVVVDSAGLVVDSLPAIHLGSMSQLRNVSVALAPYMSRTILAPTPSGDIWFASTDQYVLFRRTPDGDTTLVTELEAPSVALDETAQDSLDVILKHSRQPIDAAALGVGPQYLQSFSADAEGNLLVRSHLADGDGTAFEMFDPQGRFLGSVRADVTLESKPRVLFHRGAVYGVATDELGVPYLVRAQVRLPTTPQ